MIDGLAGLVLLIGPPGAGKSTFAQDLVERGVIESVAWISNDRLAIEMFGSEIDRQRDDGAIFAEQDRRVTERLAQGESVVVDATNVKPEARQRLIALARAQHQPVTAIRFNRSDATLLQQNRNPDRTSVMPDEFVLNYAALMRTTTSDSQLHAEGISTIYDVCL